LKVTPDCVAKPIPGTGDSGFSGDGGPATAAQLNGPSGTALDIYGNLYIADTMNHRIRKVAGDGTISSIAGAGSCGFSGDGGDALTAQLCMPAEVVLDTSGNLYVADYGNQRVRQIAFVLTVFSCGSVPSGTTTTVAGNGQNGYRPISDTVSLKELLRVLVRTCSARHITSTSRTQFRNSVQAVLRECED
jgi:hypothetical protein